MASADVNVFRADSGIAVFTCFHFHGCEGNKANVKIGKSPVLCDGRYKSGHSLWKIPILQLDWKFKVGCLSRISFI